MSVSSSVEAPERTAPPANGQSARRAETRRRLVAAATRLFAEAGLHGATSARIAAEAGVATGTFYLHFEDKHALFSALVSEALDDLRDRQERAADACAVPGGELRARLEALVAFTEEKRDLIRVVFARGAESGPIAHEIQDRVAAGIEARLRERIAGREVPLHAGIAAQSRAATLTRVIAWWAEDPSRASRDDLIETLLLLEPGRLIAREGD